MTRASYHTPRSHKRGDGLLLIFKVLAYTPGIALVLSTIAVASWIAIGDPKQVTPRAGKIVLYALTPSFVAAVLIACRSLQWGVEIDEHSVRLVRACASKRVSYDHVSFLRLGTLSDRMQRGEARRPRDMRVLIGYRPHGRFSTWLHAPDAERLFTALRERCDHAAAIDAKDREHAPRRDPGGAGLRLLSRKRLISGTAMVAAGLFILVLSLFGKNTAGAGDVLEYTRREVIRWLGIIQAPVLISAGLSVLRRRPGKR